MKWVMVGGLLPGKKPEAVHVQGQEGKFEPRESQEETVPNIKEVVAIIGQHKRVY
jgi:hypothetical protein